MELSMYGGVTNLPAHDHVMSTGHMGDCVTVIVLWNLAGTTYQNVRGQHGLGGIEAIDFNALFNGVPDAVTTQVIVIASRMGSVSYLLDNVQGRIAGQFALATIRVVKNASYASVNRHAMVS
ncbi:hypothetical protein [Sorangium sp. So ce1000]|uniref:hypothetical protein n=1 Tax=Sorangium sp. So ce1000 TaxID=3133325 RepID=UPI003F61787D